MYGFLRVFTGFYGFIYGLGWNFVFISICFYGWVVFQKHFYGFLRVFTGFLRVCRSASRSQRDFPISCQNLVYPQCFFFISSRPPLVCLQGRRSAGLPASRAGEPSSRSLRSWCQSPRAKVPKLNIPNGVPKPKVSKRKPTYQIFQRNVICTLFQEKVAKLALPNENFQVLEQQEPAEWI